MFCKKWPTIHKPIHPKPIWIQSRSQKYNPFHKYRTMGKIPIRKLKSCPKFNSNDDPRIFHTNLRRNLIWHDIYPRVKAHETQLWEGK